MGTLTEIGLPGSLSVVFGSQEIVYIRTCQRSGDGYLSLQQPVIKTPAVPLPILLINQADAPHGSLRCP